MLISRSLSKSLKWSLLTGCIIIAAVFWNCSPVNQPGQVQKAQPQVAQDSTQQKKKAVGELSSVEHLSEAQSLLTSSQRMLQMNQPSISSDFLADGIKHLAAIPQNSSEAIQAKNLKRQYRDAMAKSIENSFLKDGYSVDVVANGPDHTTLLIKWVLVSKALAYQFAQNNGFFDTAKKAGFKNIKISDGYDEAWAWQLN
jgi:hypothetical protein